MRGSEFLKLNKDCLKWTYECCGGDPQCANNSTKKFIDYLFGLARSKRRSKQRQFKTVLYDYIENIETDRDFQKLKRQEAMDELHKLKETKKATKRDALNP